MDEAMARQHMVGDQKTGPSTREGSAGTGLKLQRAIGKHMDGRVRQTSMAEGGETRIGMAWRRKDCVEVATGHEAGRGRVDDGCGVV